MRVTWNAFYVLLFAYRSAFSVLGHLVVMRLTSIPDTAGFLTTDLTQLAAKAQHQEFAIDLAMQMQAGLLTQAVASVFYVLSGGSAILIHIGFQAIAFWGIVLFLRSVRPGPRAFLAVLLMFPSFTVWTSIASKEAIVVFLVAILAKHVVDLFEGRYRSVAHHVCVLAPAALLLFLFKPHFLAAVIFMIGVSKLAKYVRHPATFALACSVASLGLLFVLRDAVDTYVRARFRGIYAEPGNIQRGPPFLIDQYDTFLRAPAGMLRSFVGPTLTEATDGVLQMVTFVESVTLVVILALYVLPRLPRTPVFMAILSCFTVFWILFATYPLGVANAGTAVRYRADYLLIVLLALVPLLSRRTYVEWRKVGRGRSARPRPVAAATVTVGP